MAIGRKPGDNLIMADKLAEPRDEGGEGRGLRALGGVAREELAAIIMCVIRSRGTATTFDVPLLAGDHVTDEDGTGFVHTAPGHGREDFDIWMENAARLKARGIDTAIPFTVDADGRFTKEAPGFEGKRVIDDKGNKGDANEAVIKALAEAGMIIARGRLKHQYPHSWRSKKPVIFRNTPQWFIAMDKPLPRQTLPADRRRQESRRCARSRCRPSPRPSSCRRPGRTGCAAWWSPSPTG